MAVTVTGTPVTDNTTFDDGSISITIPSDADAVIVVSFDFAGGVANSLNELNFDNGATQDFTEIVRVAGTGNDYDVYAYIMVSTDTDWPGTGPQTLYWGFATTPAEGGTVHAWCVTGLDTSDPIIDTDSGKQSNLSTSFTGVSSGDLSYGLMADWDARTLTNAGAGQTVQASGTSENVADWMLVREDGESALSVTTSASAYEGWVAFALRQSVAGVAPTGTTGGPLAGPLGGGLIE